MWQAYGVCQTLFGYAKLYVLRVPSSRHLINLSLVPSSNKINHTIYCLALIAAISLHLHKVRAIRDLAHSASEPERIIETCSIRVNYKIDNLISAIFTYFIH